MKERVVISESELSPLRVEKNLVENTISVPIEIATRLEKLGLLDQHCLYSMTDVQGRIEDVNELFCRTSGYSAEELIGRRHDVVKSNEHPAEFFCGLWRTIAQGRVWTGDIKNRKKNGDIYWVKTTIAPVLDDRGKPVRYISLRTDITANKLLELELKSARELAEAANIVKSQFLATMSHELRTPMNGVLGMAQLLQMPELSEADRIEYAGVIVTSGNVLMGLLNDILDLSKVEAGKFEFQTEVLNPLQIMRDVNALYSQNARIKGLNIDCFWHGSIATYIVDTRRLTQMLANIVNNAIKFTAHGRIHIEAREIESNQRNGLLEFSVSDTGIGIAQDKLHLLFQTFSQVDGSSTRRYEGTGLGLSLVRSFAELMGGEVGVESQVGQGSRFWFRIRAERIDVGPAH